MQRALKDEDLDGFRFDDGGRTYSCSVGALQAGLSEAWWWFRVSPGASGSGSLPSWQRQWLPEAPATGSRPVPAVQTEAEDRQRYAPFRVAATDTRRSVEARVVAYYDDLMARRSMPVNHSWRQGPRAPRAAPR